MKESGDKIYGSEIKKLFVSLPKEKPYWFSPHETYKKESRKNYDQSLKEAEARRRQLDNYDREQDIKLKKNTLSFIQYLLILQIIAMYALIIFQGFKFWSFNIEEWGFRIIVSSTVLESYFILRIAVEYLFPQQKNK